MSEKPSRSAPTGPAVPPPASAFTPDSTGCISNIARIWWSALGFFPLFLLAVKIGIERGLVLTRDDAFYGGFWFLLLASRVADAVVLHGVMGTTGHDRPATLKDAWMYALLVTLGAAAAWCLAHAIASMRG